MEPLREYSRDVPLRNLDPLNLLVRREIHHCKSARGIGIRVAIESNGKFTVTNSRNGFSQTYQASSGDY